MFPPQRQSIKIRLVPDLPTTSSQISIKTQDPMLSFVQVTWKRISPITNQRQEIANQSIAYDCSPLDLNCIIEATVFSNDNKVRVCTTREIKIDKQLQEMQLYVAEEINCGIKVDGLRDFVLDFKVNMDCANLTIVAKDSAHEISFSRSDFDFKLCLSNQQLRVDLTNRMPTFKKFVQGCISKNLPDIPKAFTLDFRSRLDRDIVLLNLIRTEQKGKTNSIRLNGSIDLKCLRKVSQTAVVDNSLEPLKRVEGKIKLSSAVKKCMGKSTPQERSVKEQDSRHKHCLNLFDQFDQLEDPVPKYRTAKELSQRYSQEEGNVMDLKDSFLAFENRSVHSNADDHESTRAALREIQFEEENLKLKKENFQVRQQMAELKKHLQETERLREELARTQVENQRLQGQNRAITEEKLVFESRMYREAHERQTLRQRNDVLEQELMALQRERKLSEAPARASHSPDMRRERIRTDLRHMP